MAFDVVVVGGGPVGSHLAYRVACSGYSVAVLEQKRDPQKGICCTGIVSEECLREFEIAESLVFRHCKGATLYSPSGAKVRLERQSDQAAILNRPAFNLFMADRARGAGAEYAMQARVTDIILGSDKASVAAVVAEQRTMVEAKVVVLATGSDGMLSRKLGLGAPGHLVGGAQVEVESNGLEEVEVYFGRNVAAGFFAWLVPTSQDKALAGLLAPSNSRALLAAFLAYLTKKDRILKSCAGVTSAALPLRAISRSYANRLLIVGTAAGLVKPTTGGGIYYGLLSADIAAEVLKQALEEADLSTQRLSLYQSRWTRLLGMELKAGYWGRALLEHMSDRQLERAFDTMRRPGRIETVLAQKDLLFDWHSRAMARLLREETLAKLIKGIEIPFSGRKRTRD